MKLCGNFNGSVILRIAEVFPFDKILELWYYRLFVKIEVVGDVNLGTLIDK